MFEELKVIEIIPDQEWVNRLRKGNYVYLVKEKTFALVEWEFDPPEVGYLAGRLGIKTNSIFGVWNSHSWFVRPNGTGLDSKPLILPVENHLSDNPEPIDEPVIRQMKRTIANLEHRVLMLERGLWLADSLSGLQPRQSYPRKKRP
ncbi:MAG TPA: hypothetical protein VM577_00740 [Anaerovoracaceae bacterium]|nr:hypothetical protein [Anaerovoracaceae bacterium]